MNTLDDFDIKQRLQTIKALKDCLENLTGSIDLIHELKGFGVYSKNFDTQLDTLKKAKAQIEDIYSELQKNLTSAINSNKKIGVFIA